MHLTEGLEHWLAALEAEGRRPATVSTYRWLWTPFARWLADQNVTDMDSLNPLVVRRYLAEYSKSHSPISVRALYYAMSAFCNWATLEGLLTATPMKNMRRPKADQPIKTALSKGHVRAMFAALQDDKTPLGLRNLALVAILCDTGARASEVCAVRLSDLQGETILLRRTKNGKPRIAYMGTRASQALHRYLASGRPHLQPQGDTLFVSAEGKPLTRNALRCMLDRLGAKVGFRIHAHLLRHTWATQMARAGVEANALMALAGWTEISMATRYVHLASNDLRDAHAQAKPLDGVL